MALSNPLDSRFRGNDGVKIGNYSAIIASLRPSRLCVKFIVSTRPNTTRSGMMGAASWIPSLPLIIIFLLGALALWLAMRIEVDRTIADLRRELREARAELKTDIRKVGGKIDAINVRASEYELEQARQEGMMRILGRQTHTHEPKRDPTDDA